MNSKLDKAISDGRNDAAQARATEAARKEQKAAEERGRYERLLTQYKTMFEAEDLLYDKVREAVADGKDSFLLFSKDICGFGPENTMREMSVAIGRISGFRALYDHDNRDEASLHVIKVSWSYL